MGKMTDEEKQKVMDMLEDLEREELNKVLGSQSSFRDWLRTSLYSIYCKVKDALERLWTSIRNFFS